MLPSKHLLEATYTMGLRNPHANRRVCFLSWMLGCQFKICDIKSQSLVLSSHFQDFWDDFYILKIS